MYSNRIPSKTLVSIPGFILVFEFPSSKEILTNLDTKLMETCTGTPWSRMAAEVKQFIFKRFLQRNLHMYVHMYVCICIDSDRPGLEGRRFLFPCVAHNLTQI